MRSPDLLPMDLWSTDIQEEQGRPSRSCTDTRTNNSLPRKAPANVHQVYRVFPGIRLADIQLHIRDAKRLLCKVKDLQELSALEMASESTMQDIDGCTKEIDHYLVMYFPPNRYN